MLYGEIKKIVKTLVSVASACVGRVETRTRTAGGALTVKRSPLKRFILCDNQTVPENPRSPPARRLKSTPETDNPLIRIAEPLAIYLMYLTRLDTYAGATPSPRRGGGRLEGGPLVGATPSCWFEIYGAGGGRVGSVEFVASGDMHRLHSSWCRCVLMFLRQLTSDKRPPFSDFPPVDISLLDVILASLTPLSPVVIVGQPSVQSESNQIGIFNVARITGIITAKFLENFMCSENYICTIFENKADSDLKKISARCNTTSLQF